MQNLDLEQFSPKRAELIALAEDAKGIQIFGPDDKAGYDRAQTVRMKLKNARVEIQKTGKAMRADALAFQKAVIEREKELVEIIEPMERQLEAKQQDADDERERNKRVALLPGRKERLVGIPDYKLELSDDQLIAMDDVQFETYFNDRHAAHLRARQDELDQEEARLAAEKRKIQDDKDAEEAEKRRQAEIEQARKDGEAKAQREAAERERKRQEDERLEAERLDKDRHFQAFLKSHGYTEETKAEFHIVREAGKVVLFKKVAEINL